MAGRKTHTMHVTYTIHDYAGRKGEDRTVTVSGHHAALVMAYSKHQDEVGITIADVDEAAPDTVPSWYACPTCGERRLDWLVWIEGDTVRCQSCKTTYTVPEEV